MVVGVPRTGGGIVVAVTEKNCCGVAVSRGVFCFVGPLCGLVACTGEAILGSFSWPWTTNDEGDDTLSRSGPYQSGVGGAHVFRPAHLLG